MKEHVKAMFEQITMPQSTEDTIRKEMGTYRSRKNQGRTWKNMTAAAAVLGLMLAVSPKARAAVEEWLIRYVFPESGITVYEERDGNGNPAGLIVVYDTETPAFAHVENDRLIFTGNGENLDITDQITEEEPYIYNYVDEYGLTHHMAVGYQGSIENFGIYEFFREEKEGQQPWEGWGNGCGRNYIADDGSCYPWVSVVWEKLDIPWPMPK